MRYAIFSDIHSNLEGLQTVLQEAEKAGVDSFLCCGDVIGYNADPNACVDLVQEKKVRCIRGNHERGLQELEQGEVPNMNPVAMEALQFTLETLDDKRREWLISLPDKLLIEDSFYLFHGSPGDPDDYIFDAFEAAYAFKSLVYEYPSPANMLCFIGHTHICACHVFEPGEQQVVEKLLQGGEVISMEPGRHYMFNVGSCGQYRGGSPVATLGILDTDEMSMEYHFLGYDYRTSQEKIVEARLPLFLAQRLGMGQ